MNLTDDQRAELEEIIDRHTWNSVGLCNSYHGHAADDQEGGADHVVDLIKPLIERFIRDAQARAFDQGVIAAGLAELDGTRTPGRYRVGNHYRIHVYEGVRAVATFFDADEAARFVEAANAAESDPRAIPNPYKPQEDDQ